MTILLVRHGLSEANDKESAAFGQDYAQLLPQGIEHARNVKKLLLAKYNIDPAIEAAAASTMTRSHQTASIAGFLTVNNYAILNEVDVPKTYELRAVLDRGEILPEAKDAAELVLANPPKEKIWFTHGYLIAALCRLMEVDTSGLRFIPKFGEVRELPLDTK